MEQQNQQPENMPNQTGVTSNQAHGGHELMDAHEAIGTVISGLEQYLLFEERAQDQELTTMIQRHRSFMSQMYNTIIDTLKTGQDPSVPTQTYHIENLSDVTYGMQPSAPKSPAQSVSGINDECVSGYLLGILKSTATAFTTTALEATNPVLRRVFADSIPNVIEMAYEVFLYQNRNSYYQVPQLQPEAMQMIQNGYSSVQGNMPH